MGQKVVGDICSLRAQLPDGPVEIDRVPVNNGCRDEAQARRTETLVLECAVADFPLAMKEHRAAQRVARLALVGLDPTFVSPAATREIFPATSMATAGSLAALSLKRAFV